MGTSTSVRQFSGKITKMATVTQRHEKELVNQAALVVKELIYAEAAVRGVSPTSKIAGGNWGARYDIKGFQNPTALVRVWGPFHLVERDTKAHMIYRRGRRVTGRGARRINRHQSLAEVFGGTGAYNGGALLMPDGKFRHVVHHPGTTGKGIFDAAKVKARVAVPIIMSSKLTTYWADALR